VTRARQFVLRGLAASLGLFGVLRLAWTEAHVVLPATQMQARLAVRWFGEPSEERDSRVRELARIVVGEMPITG